MLVRLMYASRAVDTIGSSLIDAIIAEAHAHNGDHGITGVLCAYPQGDVFMQALEGARDEVNRLYQNIVRDPRHREVTLLEYAEIAERAFASWRMGRVDLNRVNLSTILRYSERSQLDPFSLPGKTALALLLELSTTMSVVGRGEPLK
jgi:hypothetical protein